MTPYVQEENNLNDGRLLIRNHGGQKEVKQYFYNAKRKERSTWNPIPSENVPQGRRADLTFADKGKLRECLP